MVKIAPSILAGDHGNLAAEARKVESFGADWIHIDIMDGEFAPNLTFGPGAVKAIRNAVKIPLDCHLMINRPERFVETFAEAGGDYITVHVETVTEESLRTIERLISKNDKKLGVAFKPSTELSCLQLSEIDVSLVTIMTVNPGFSGQKFMPEVLYKIDEAKRSFRSRGTEIEVDGGIDLSNSRSVCERGATVLVAGNSIFGQLDQKKAFEDLKKIASLYNN